MSGAARTMLVFGIYVAVMGVLLVALPNLLLGLLGLPPTDEVWIRVVGVLALVIAAFYLVAGRANLRPFFRLSLYTRAGVFLGFTALALAGLGSPMLILFGAVDLAGAAWTGWALRAERQGAIGGAPAM
ncbi:MAG TPA: hypothetical protein PKD53_10570 [Chloroflexaceae bacterium]|nr:hypothetical protein [Chloroflexaceae bacterium]